MPVFRKFLVTSLHVIFGLGPPIKNPGYAYGWLCDEKICDKKTCFYDKKNLNY